MLTLGTLLVLRAADVPLGQGSFRYLYSNMNGIRAARAWPVILAAGAIVLAFRGLARTQVPSWRSGNPTPVGSTRWSGPASLTLLSLVVAALATWTFLGPPRAVVQHSFNFRSPSHEGAFLAEAQLVQSMQAYLRSFDSDRLQRSPTEMRGTRVISNPPGTTLLLYATARLYPPQIDPPGMLERYVRDRFDVDDDDLAVTMLTLHSAGLVTALWAMATLPLYALGRQFLPPAGAAAFMLIAWFNPSTVHFTPGKDPAQLLTVSTMLWAWFASFRTRGRATAAALAALSGAALAVGSTFSLIHIWIALPAAAATLWNALVEPSAAPLFAVRPQARAVLSNAHITARLPLMQLLCAAIGALLVCLLAWAFWGWNLPATLLAVWHRFGQVQQTIALSRPTWFVIGLPLFALFVSPAVVTFAALGIRRAVRHRRARGGIVYPHNPSAGLAARLAVSTAGAMLLAYLVGVTYELPRLWVAFLPPLTLGVMAASPLARVHGTNAGHGSSLGATRGCRVLATIVVVHILFTAAHWSLLDVRESEHRLSGSGRFFSLVQPAPPGPPAAAFGLRETAELSGS